MADQAPEIEPLISHKGTADEELGGELGLRRSLSLIDGIRYANTAVQIDRVMIETIAK